tara:strand:+ start:830 stop:979 length:150 start_codon:yes stop_codon:yes gene_type:complete
MVINFIKKHKNLIFFKHKYKIYISSVDTWIGLSYTPLIEKRISKLGRPY